VSQVRPSQVQVAFGGGMNFYNEADQLKDDEAQLIRNYRIRNSILESSKGAVEISRDTIPFLLYERWSNGIRNTDKWTFVGSSSVITPDNIRGKITITGDGAYDNEGIVSKKTGPFRPSSHIDIQFKTPSSTATSARISLQDKSSALDTGTGVEVGFENGSIFRIENGVSVDTGFGWAADTIINLVLLRQTDNTWSFIVNSGGIFDFTIAGATQSFLAMNVQIGTWEVNSIKYHRGFRDGEGVFKEDPELRKVLGLHRFYRQGKPPQLLAAFDDAVFLFQDETWIVIGENFQENLRWRFETFRGTVFVANGLDRIHTWTGEGILQPVGAGDQSAPHAKYLKAHLGRIFAAGDPNNPNTVFFSDFISNSRFDKLLDFVDLDEWKGDKITGLQILGGNLFIVKENSIWQLAGRTPEQFQLFRIPGAKGCIAPDSLVNTESSLIYLSNDGVYLFDGVQSTELSHKIRPMFIGEGRFINIEDREKRLAVAEYHDHAYRLSVIGFDIITIPAVVADHKGFNLELIYDFKSFPSDGSLGGWTFNDLFNISAYTVQVGAIDRNELIAGLAGGFVVQLELQYGGIVRKRTTPLPTSLATFCSVTPETETPLTDTGLVIELPTNKPRLYISKLFGSSDPLVIKNWLDARVFFHPSGFQNMTYKWFTNKRHASPVSGENEFLVDLEGTREDTVSWQLKHNSLACSFLLANNSSERVTNSRDLSTFLNLLADPTETRSVHIDHKYRNSRGEFFHFEFETPISLQRDKIRAVQLQFIDHNENVRDK